MIHVKMIGYTMILVGSTLGLMSFGFDFHKAARIGTMVMVVACGWNIARD
jgi:hypothetical protein